MRTDVAIVDYGLGNLFSIQNACEVSGLSAKVTSQIKEMEQSSLLILPGVGAFAEAMNHLKKLDLISPLRDWAASGKPMIGICLGMQLLFTESHEFGIHQGLGVIPGKVLPLKDKLTETAHKVPHIGWNRIFSPPSKNKNAWEDSVLKSVSQNAMMYFVHSYYCAPADSGVILSQTRYGGFEFCCGLSYKNVTAFQFHPERSGASGLLIYKNLAQTLLQQTKE